MTGKEWNYWLCNIDGVGAKTIKKLLECVGTPEELFACRGEKLKEWGLLKNKAAQNFDESKRNLKKLMTGYHRLESLGIAFVTPEDETYPKRLESLYDKPYGLYVKGKLPEEAQKTAAIIGARACSSYGKEMAEYMGAELSRAGVQIVSGLASGIDVSGHKGALKAGGSTFGVLGNGVDFCYPEEHYLIYEEMQLRGGVLSEFPIGTAPRPGNFPMRNRIISGLSDVVIVIEARERSGSLITVDMALEQGKDVFALPGRVGDKLCEGCNRLIQNGAGILLEPDDILDFLQISHKKDTNLSNSNKIALATDENKVYSCLDFTPMHMEMIVKHTGFSIGKVMKCLLKLELSGFIKQTTPNYYSKTIEVAVHGEVFGDSRISCKSKNS